MAMFAIYQRSFRLGWIQELKQHLCFLSDPLSGWLSQWLGKLATRAALDSAFPAQVHEDENSHKVQVLDLTLALSHAPVSGQTLC